MRNALLTDRSRRLFLRVAAGAAVSFLPCWTRALAAAAPARRIVALGPGALRMICYLGATERRVGIEDAERGEPSSAVYRLALEETGRALPTVGPGGPGRLPDLERLISLRPDLAVTVMLDASHTKAIRERAGIPVLALRDGSAGLFDEDAYFAKLKELGAALGLAGRAAELTTYFRASLQEIARRIAGRTPPPVFLGGVSLQGAHGLMSTQAGHPPLRWAGAKNLADEVGERTHLFLDREQMLAWDPPTIFLDGGGLASIRGEYARDRAFFDALRAVRTKRVFVTLPFNSYDTNVENALANAWFIARVLHADAFVGVDVRARIEQVFQVFLGIAALPMLEARGYGLGRYDLASGRWSAAF